MRPFLILLLLSLLPIGGYVASQQPKFWINSEWAGVMLLKGGYRSWSLRFCDGQLPVNGKVQDVVFTGGDSYRVGHYLVPRFHHADARGISFNLIIDRGTTTITNGIQIQ